MEKEDSAAVEQYQKLENYLKDVRNSTQKLIKEKENLYATNEYLKVT
jgi:hypothetical protein